MMNHGTAYLEGWTAQRYAWGGATIPLPISNSKRCIHPAPGFEPAPDLQPFINPALIGTAAAVSDDTARIKYNTNAVPYMTQQHAEYRRAGTQSRQRRRVSRHVARTIDNIGLRVGYMSASKKDTDNTATGTTFQRNESAIQEPSVGLGVQIKNLGPGYLDVAGSFSLPSAKWDAAATNTYSAKNKFAYIARTAHRPLCYSDPSKQADRCRCCGFL
ncbi:MAG: hypothetical protein U1F16_04420 [Turneriella sp.]